MLKRIPIIITIICSVLWAKGQSGGVEIEGQISFISSKNVYVKFSSTENMHPGDTLYIKTEQSFIPALQIKQTSSISCICEPLSDFKFTLLQKVYLFIKKTKITSIKVTKEPVDTIKERDKKPQLITSVPHRDKDTGFRGRLTLSSYTNLSDSREKNNTRFRYNLKLDIGNIQAPGFSAESYLMFTHKLNNAIVPDGFRIYNLAVHYNLNNHVNFWIGRKINDRISNVGAIDGLQVEVRKGDFYLGMAGGSRPDYFNYTFNSFLLQYGAWLGHHHIYQKGTSISSTLSFFEQKNHGKTDRRFAYIQHDNNLLKNVNLFMSMEIDLFRIENNLPVNSPSLTSLYLSLRYKITRQLSIYGSFDQRKNVIYYETFRSFGDSLFEAVTRKGLQIRTNYHANKNLLLSLNAGHQFGNKDGRSTDNASGSLFFTRIPGLNTSVTLSANYIGTNYLNGQSAGLKFEKELLQGQLLTGAGYRYNRYELLSSSAIITEQIAILNFSWQIHRTFSFNLEIEKAFANQTNYSNIYTSIIKRF